MELVVSLPPELAAIADPSARGTAPWLRPTGPPAAGTDAPAAFERLLALLNGPSPAGQVWPPGGKELPVLPLDPATETDAAAEVATMLPTSAGAFAAERVLPPTFAAGPLAPGFAAGPLPAGLPGQAASPPPLSQVLGSGELPATATGAANLGASVRNGESASAASSPPTLAALDSLAAGATADTQQAPLDGADPQPGASVAARMGPSWLEAFGERRWQRPVATTSTEMRAGAQPAPALGAPSAAAIRASGEPPAAAAQVFWGAMNDGPRIELAESVAPSPAFSDSTDWLPPPAAHATATNSVTPSGPAAPGAAVDMRSPSWQEAFANRVQWVVDTKVGEAHIKLNPPELGAVDVKISLVDDKTFVHLTAATAAARDELAHGLPRLRELFTSSGLELGGASVHNGRDGQQAGYGAGHGDGHGNRRPGDGATAPATPFTPLRADRDGTGFVPRRALGHIDLFA